MVAINLIIRVPCSIAGIVCSFFQFLRHLCSVTHITDYQKVFRASASLSSFTRSCSDSTTQLITGRCATAKLSQIAIDHGSWIQFFYLPHNQSFWLSQLSCVVDLVLGRSHNSFAFETVRFHFVQALLVFCEHRYM